MSPRTEARAGSVLLAEIHQQPAVLRRLVEASDAVAEAAARVRRRRPSQLRLVAHGTSDNAATFGVYAIGRLAGLTAFRDSISLPVYYGAEIDVREACVLALSQSGETPDVVEYAKRSRSAGALTLAVTNDPTSALGEAADEVIALNCGVEHAIAATKTYTAQLATLALFAAHLAGQGRRYEEGLLEAADTLDEQLEGMQATAFELAQRFAAITRMFIIGRGGEYATAREIALKLLEVCRVAAIAWTTTDVLHGPVAALNDDVPTWALGDAAMQAPLAAAISRTRAAGSPVILTVGSGLSHETGCSVDVRPPSLPILAPLLTVVPGQLFAWALARAKGLDPDQPHGLSKVTAVP